MHTIRDAAGVLHSINPLKDEGSANKISPSNKGSSDKYVVKTKSLVLFGYVGYRRGSYFLYCLERAGCMTKSALWVFFKKRYNRLV